MEINDMGDAHDAYLAAWHDAPADRRCRRWSDSSVPLTSEDGLIACALIVEAWARDAHGWKLHRELTEHSVEPSNGSGKHFS